MQYEMQTDLPSMSVFYEDIPSRVVLRNITTGEEQKLFGGSAPDTIDRVLNSCIVEPKGLNVKDLIPADKHFLTIKLRVHTYGSDYKFMAYCPFCDCDHEVTVDLDKMEVNYLSEDCIKLPLKLSLPVCKDQIQLKVLTGHDYDAIDAKATKLSHKVKTPVNEIKYQLKLARQITHVNGEAVDIYEAEKYIQGMHGRDSAYISSALRSIKVGYTNTVEVKCPGCGQEITTFVEVSPEFLRPSYEIKWE